MNYPKTRRFLALVTHVQRMHPTGPSATTEYEEVRCDRCRHWSLTGEGYGKCAGLQQDEFPAEGGCWLFEAKEGT